MPRHDLTEEEAKVIFAEQLRALAAEGPDPDCETRIAEIIAENEAECARMEMEFAAAEAEDQGRRSAVGSLCG